MEMLGEYMTQHTLTPILPPINSSNKILEEARIAHERYLIKQQEIIKYIIINIIISYPTNMSTYR